MMTEKRNKDIVMKLSKVVLTLGLCLCAAACGTSTRIYYWEKPLTGTERFVQDHNRCLEKADLWPWTWAAIGNSPETLDMRLRLREGGIWANFSPYPGAQPVFVNSTQPTTTVIYHWYSSCMTDKGYKERRPYTGPMSLVE